jgi:hypothetical protein
MGDRSVSRPHRYVALLFVVVLHFGLVTVLVLASRTRARSPTGQSLATTLVLLPKAAAIVPSAPPIQMRLPPVAPVAPPTVPIPSITSPSIDDADDAPARVDWRGEATRAAAAISKSLEMPEKPQERRRTSSDPGPRPWFPRSKHHAGEEYTDQTGNKVVWINDKCYIRSSAPIIGVPDLIARGMLSATFCPRDSGPARGDLFEALPAYKKLHPEAAEPAR